MELEITAHHETLATKSDLKDAFHSLDLKMEAIRNDLRDAVHGLELKIEGVRGEIEGVRGGLRAEIKESESKTARWVLTCTMGQAAMIAGAVYFALTHLR